MMGDGYYKKNSGEYEHAMFTQSTPADHIYFDEKEEYKEVRGVFDARLIISTIISASKGDMHRLQSIMSLFAGLSLRESAAICGKSHEYVRLVAKSIKEDYPELYEVITANVRGTVDSLIPLAGVHKWSIENEETGEIEYSSNLSQYCRDKGLNKFSAQGAYSRGKSYKGYLIKKVNHEKR
jgi:hypothetical protein